MSTQEQRRPSLTPTNGNGAAQVFLVPGDLFAATVRLVADMPAGRAASVYLALQGLQPVDPSDEDKP